MDFIWKDAGISLRFPAASLKKEIEMSVEIFKTGEEHCIWPQQYRFVPPASAAYKITASGAFSVPVRVRVQHCIVTDKEHSMVHMVAHSGPPFKFKPLNSGIFPPGKSYGEIQITEFSIWKILCKFFPLTTSLAIHVVYFSDSTAQIAVTKNISAHRTAVREEYPNAPIDSYLMTCSFTTTEIAFLGPNQTADEGWSINMAPTPAEINLNNVHGYEVGSVIPTIKVKLEWKGNGRPQEQVVQIRVCGGSIQSFPLYCKPPPCAHTAISQSSHQASQKQPQSTLAPAAKPQLEDLTRELKKLTWPDVKQMAIQLGIKHPRLEEFEQKTTYSERLLATMNAWLSQDTEASWTKIVEALEEIEQNVLAENIRGKWIPGAKDSN